MLLAKWLSSTTLPTLAGRPPHRGVGPLGGEPDADAGADAQPAERAVVGEVLDVDAGGGAVDVDRVEAGAVRRRAGPQTGPGAARRRAAPHGPRSPIHTQASALPSEEPGRGRLDVGDVDVREQEAPSAAGFRSGSLASARTPKSGSRAREAGSIRGRRAGAPRCRRSSSPCPRTRVSRMRVSRPVPQTAMAAPSTVRAIVADVDHDAANECPRRGPRCPRGSARP